MRCLVAITNSDEVFRSVAIAKCEWGLDDIFSFDRKMRCDIYIRCLVAIAKCDVVFR